MGFNAAILILFRGRDLAFNAPGVKAVVHNPGGAVNLNKTFQLRLRANAHTLGNDESGVLMIRFLTFSLSLYWAIFFALNAVSLLALSGQGAAHMAGVVSHGLPGLGEAVSARPFLNVAFVAVFTLSAALFLWCIFASVLLSGENRHQFRDVTGAAFSIAAAAMTMVLASAVTVPSTALFQAIGLTIAGLAGSYAAIAAERIAEQNDEIEHEGQTLARVMALNAAHSSLLARFSGRDGNTGGGGG